MGTIFCCKDHNFRRRFLQYCTFIEMLTQFMKVCAVESFWIDIIILTYHFSKSTCLILSIEVLRLRKDWVANMLQKVFWGKGLSFVWNFYKPLLIHIVCICNNNLYTIELYLPYFIWRINFSAHLFNNPRKQILFW